MENYIEKKLTSSIEGAALIRLNTSFKIFSLVLGFNMIADVLINGPLSNLQYKITLLLWIPVFKLFFKGFRSSKMNKMYLSIILGEILNVFIVYLNYFLFSNYKIIISHMAAFVFMYYQSYLCISIKTCILMSIKQTVVWISIGLYLNEIESTNPFSLILCSIWLFCAMFRATYFQFLKEIDIIQAKFKIKLAKDNYHSILETVQDLIIVISKDKKILFTNPAAKEFLDSQTLYETLEKYSYSKKYSKSYLNETIKNDIEKSLDFSLNFQIQYGIIENQGNFFELNGKIIKWEDNNNVLVLYGRNLTRIIELEKENKENSYRSVLIKTVSHELRTPINAILNLGAQIKESGELSEVNKGKMKVLLGTCNYQLCIINDLLDYAQIVAGCLRIAKLPFICSELVADCISYIQPQVSPNVELVTKIGKIPDVLVSDPNRLKQIILNLLSNARKFTTHGQIVLSVNYTSPNLEISCSDTGIGIPTEKISKLFEEFSRIDSYTHLNTQGVGLGLAISNKLVKALQGESIKVNSIGGVGSTFSFFIQTEISEYLLTETDSENIDVSMPAMVCKNLMTKEDILIVDDVYFNVMAYTEILKSEGFNCNYAENGEVAIEMILKKEYKCVLMDCEMPVLNGWETTKRLIQLNIEQKLKKIPPIIASTAYNDPEITKKCIDAGMNDVITKPCPKEVLMQKINYWILNAN